MATISKRANAMKHFVDWCAEFARLVLLPIAEESAFEYLRTLTSPSAGWFFVSSLNFAHGIFGLDGAQATASSAR
eukprot:5627015-Amphidinium_carterae.1